MDIQKTDINTMDIYNTLVTTDNGNITEYDIQECIDRYIDTLKDPNDIYNNKTMSFNGLLRFIYNTKLKHIVKHSNDHDYNYPVLDSIFTSIYLPLCYKFNHVPSVSNYCNHLINIYISNIYDIRTGLYRPDYTAKVNPITRSYITKWDEMCDTDLVDYIVHTNSIGGIFRAKTKGFREEQPIKLEISVQAPTLDTKQLDRIANTETPILPDNTPE